MLCHEDAVGTVVNVPIHHCADVLFKVNMMCLAAHGKRAAYCAGMCPSRTCYCADFMEVFYQRPDSTYVIPPEPVTKSESDDGEEEEEEEEEVVDEEEEADEETYSRQ